VRRSIVALALLATAPSVGALAAAASPRADEPSDVLAPVDVVEVSGLIDEVVAASIEEAVARAEAEGSQAVVFQVNSRGALIGRQSMADLLGILADSPVPIAVWVGPSGARATGLAAQMMAVADVTAMAPGTRVGDTGTLLSIDGEKVSFGAADSLLTNSTMGFLEAREAGVLRFANDDQGVPVIRNMLLALDGLEVNGRVLDTVVDALDDDGQVVREATTARFFKLGLLDQLVHTVSSPASAYLLMTIGLALLVFELFTAGIGVAGLVGALCTVLGGLGFGAVPVSGTALALLLASMVAFAIDVQVGIPRLWTGIGMVLYVVASWTLFEPVDGLSLRPSWITLTTGIVGVALTFVVGMPSMTRTRFATPTIGREWLIGAEGEAAGTIDPNGLALVDGARWRARTNRATPLADRQPLRVVGIDGITLDVEPLEGAARDYRERRRSGGGADS
jgi:membrane-bound serine protease (ClpP class)